jgi:acyl-CoA thioesterase-1
VNKKIAAILFIALAATVVPAQIKISCIGNSITAGDGLSDSSRSYPSVLEQLLGPSEYTVRTDGINGATMLREGDIPYWTSGKIAEVAAFQPDIVTIMLGTNDTRSVNWNAFGDRFRQDYEAFIDTLSTLSPQPQVFLVLPPPIFANTFDLNNDIMVNNIVPTIREIGADRGLPVIDVNMPLRNRSFLFPDGVHPTENGAALIARIFYNRIQHINDPWVHARAPDAPAGRPTAPIIVLPVFMGSSLPVLISSLKAGQWYDLHLFDARGVLTGKFTVDASPGSWRAVIKRAMATAPVMRLAEVRRRNAL